MSTPVTVALSATRLRRAIRAVGHAMATTHDRPILNGFALSFDQGILTVMASDNYRVARVRMPISDVTDGPTIDRTMIRRDDVPVLMALLGGRYPGSVQIVYEWERLELVTETGIRATFETRSGQYPDVDKAIRDATASEGIFARPGREWSEAEWRRPIAASPLFLAQAYLAVQTAGGRIALARTTVGGPLDPIVITTAVGEDEYTEVIMPSRASS